MKDNRFKPTSEKEEIIEEKQTIETIYSGLNVTPYLSIMYDKCVNLVTFLENHNIDSLNVLTPSTMNLIDSQLSINKDIVHDAYAILDGLVLLAIESGLPVDHYLVQLSTGAITVRTILDNNLYTQHESLGDVNYNDVATGVRLLMSNKLYIAIYAMALFKSIA